MKLRTIAENRNIKAEIRQGLKAAESELDGITTDPRKVYQHVLKGVHYRDGLVVTDKNYWEEMFTYWPLVPVEVQNEHYEEISGAMIKLLTDFQEAGYLNESFAGAVVTGIAKLVGKLASGFASVVCKIAQILGATKGEQATRMGRRPSQRENAFSQLNGAAIVKYVDGMVGYSKKIKSKQNESASASNGTQASQHNSQPNTDQTAETP